jgi:hypothetical protein
MSTRKPSMERLRFSQQRERFPSMRWSEPMASSSPSAVPRREEAQALLRDIDALAQRGQRLSETTRRIFQELQVAMQKTDAALWSLHEKHERAPLTVRSRLFWDTRASSAAQPGR